MPFQPPRDFKRDLRADKPKFGVIAGVFSAQLVEMAAFIGLDYILLDLEHGGGYDVADTLPLIRAADACSMPVIVRVPLNSPDTIQRVLDHGALGVCIPHVRTARDAANAVHYARYAPAGERAMSPFVRSARFRGGPEWEEYWRTANDETVVMVIVEDREAMENLDEIAATPGIDVLWIGTGDLSQSLEIPGQSGHPLLEVARKEGLDAARRNELVSFTPLPSSAVLDREARSGAVRQSYADGYRMFAWVDVAIYDAALRELLDTARSAS